MDSGKQAKNEGADMADKSTLDAKALSKLKCTKEEIFELKLELLTSEETENQLKQLAHQR